MNTRLGYQALSWVQFFKHLRKALNGNFKPLLRYYVRRNAIRTLMQAMRKVGL